MKLRDLFDILKIRKVEFILWLLANLGAILISSLAAFTIFILHNRTGGLLPTREAFLATGTISLCIAGVSYHKSKTMNESYKLNDFFSIAGPFFLLIVYGFLIALSVAPPVISNFWIMIISIILFLFCIIWSSIIWLQIQGMERDNINIPSKPEPDDNLKKTANTLPKVTQTSIES
jgi:hypothetical protein